jgi:hypothetical protein
MTIDWSELLKAFGGGPGSAMIVVLLGAVIALWRRNGQQTDARIADQKEHTAQIIETTRLVDTAVRAMEARRD